MPYTRQFLADPAQFAQSCALIPELGQEETSRLKPKVVNPHLTLYQVKGANRILFAKIEKSTAAQNRYDIEFSAVQLTGDWFPVYWLPWKEDHTYRITLKPSKKHDVSGLERRAVDPHIFVTAAVNGCLVQVDGDPWSPTVYHSNAMRLPVTASPLGPKLAQTWTMTKKAEHMERQIAASTLAHPKGQRHYQPRSANAFDYMPHGATEEAREVLRRSAEREYGADERSLGVSLQGTVFGIKSRSTGIWSFYYQSLICYLYLKDSARFEQWIVDRFARFWPGADIQKPIPVVVEEGEED